VSEIKKKVACNALKN